jgi:hypothetical protein
MAKNSETRLKEVELKIQSFEKLSVERNSTLIQHNGRLLFVENEIKAQANTVNTLEKLLLTGYHDKEETERHRARVESELNQIKHRLDFMARPHHRAGDDRDGPQS